MYSQHTISGGVVVVVSTETRH